MAEKKPWSELSTKEKRKFFQQYMRDNGEEWMKDKSTAEVEAILAAAYGG